MTKIQEQARHRDMLLILDLDETLIFSSREPLAETTTTLIRDLYVHRRPGLAVFLETCLAWFALGIWTSGTASYASAMVSLLFPDPTQLRFVFSQQQCTMHRTWPEDIVIPIKPLKKVHSYGFPLSRTLIVDDRPETYQQNYGNAIPITSWTGDPSDDVLPRLARYLERLKDADDVRRIEKRHWIKEVD